MEICGWDQGKAVVAFQEYEKLTTTRTRQLEKPLNQIEEIRSQQDGEPERLPGDAPAA